MLYRESSFVRVSLKHLIFSSMKQRRGVVLLQSFPMVTQDKYTPEISNSSPLKHRPFQTQKEGNLPTTIVSGASCSILGGDVTYNSNSLLHWWNSSSLRTWNRKPFFATSVSSWCFALCDHFPKKRGHHYGSMVLVSRSQVSKVLYILDGHPTLHKVILHYVIIIYI